MLCCLDKYLALSNYSLSLLSCQVLRVTCNDFFCIKKGEKLEKFMVKLTDRGLVINGLISLVSYVNTTLTK